MAKKKQKPKHEVFRRLVRKSGLSLMAQTMALDPDGQFLALGEEDSWVVIVATRGAARDAVTFLEEQAAVRAACFEAEGGIVLDAEDE